MPSPRTYLSETRFKAKQLKRKLSRLARTGWYNLVRKHFEVVVWNTWNRFNWLDDKVISRRNAINRLDSLTLLSVDPRKIKFYVQPQDVDRKHFIWNGDWDLRSKSMTEHQRYQLMEDLWQHRNSLQYSRTYQQMLGDLKQGIHQNHFNRGIQVNSPESALKLLKSQSEIYDSLLTKGYQAGLATDEIKVAVDRCGNLVKANGGRKRLSAAIICGMPKIPVRIAYVHKTWVEKHRSEEAKKKDALERALHSVWDNH